MIVYKCAITGDELFTDIYKLVLKDGFYIVRGKYVTRKKGDTVDDSLIGGNASAEEPQESGGEESTESGCNVVLDNRLLPTTFGTKKEYTAYFKDYVKGLLAKKKEANPDGDFSEWQKEITASYKVALANFKEFEFFTGSSGEINGMIPLLEWKVPEGETDEAPHVWFYKEGCIEEKVVGPPGPWFIREHHTNNLVMARTV
ncbi:translationally controlled tumor protein [Elysia marginata]|uniref:Translationally controlled tumor protein n=1 Tax=Elysia marginata TaxID=1093978 RepID=A0AAV4EF26_9GAST|nr:translationally controlled tumor protein [Elysia marginata]